MKKVLKSTKLIASFMKQYAVSVIFVVLFIIATTYLNVHAPKYMGEAIDNLMSPMTVEITDKDGNTEETEIQGYVVESIKYNTFKEMVESIEAGTGIPEDIRDDLANTDDENITSLLEMSDQELQDQFSFLNEIQRIVEINTDAKTTGFDSEQIQAIKDSSVLTDDQILALTMTDQDLIDQFVAQGMPEAMAVEMMKDPKKNLPADVYSGYAAAKDLQSPEQISKLYDAAIQFDVNEQYKEAAFDKFLGSLKLLIIAYLFTAISYFMYSYLMARTSAKTVRNMRVGLFHKMEELSIRFFDTHSDGDLLSRFVNDMDNISNALTQSFTQALSQVAMLIGVIYMMFSEDNTVYVFDNGFEFHNILAWMMVAFAVLAIVSALFVIRKAQKYVTIQQEKLGNLNGYVDEQINGQKTIIAYGLQADSQVEFDNVNHDLKRTSFKGQMYSNILMPLINGFGVINLGTIVFAGSMLIVNGSDVVSVGLIAAFIQYSQRFFQPLASVLSQYNLIQLGLTGSERVGEIFDVEPEVTDNNKLGDIEGIDGKVHIKDVTFAYNPGKPVLKNVDIEVEKGKMVALVGPTGSGKTTVMNLMNRFYDVTEGQILVDDNDIRDISLASLRRNVGIVLQESVTFSGTLYDNIAYGKEDATEEEVYEAAKLANIHDFILSLEDGYQTLVDNGSSLLSTGQKQMISIARTILTDPDLLILDEATSNVDTVTEEKIQAAMKNALHNRTSFVIAHRLKTILDADIIVVLRDGEVIEKGSHDELIALDGFYAELYHNQFVVED
ncbi:ABC transporter ATP-binding protein [Mollicutes bacterium LVI A0039]|nr:ABC transporter ATP-binding protein [Mollicutes bacterium LVI A0039]